MNNSHIRWYSLNSEWVVEEHEPVELDEALKIVDRYLARGAKEHESAEQAVSATMFGFSRSGHEFIEICVNGPETISYKFEMSDPDASWFSQDAQGCLSIRGRAAFEEAAHAEGRGLFHDSGG